MKGNEKERSNSQRIIAISLFLDMSNSSQEQITQAWTSPTSMELYRCREKLYSMSKAVKFNTAKRSIFSCSFSGRSQTSIHDIFSTVCPASARIPSKRSNRSTQWYNSHWRKRKRKIRIRCLCGCTVTMNCCTWYLDKFTFHLCFSSTPPLNTETHMRKSVFGARWTWIHCCSQSLSLCILPPIDATKAPLLIILRERIPATSWGLQTQALSLPEPISFEVLVFSYQKKILLN